MWIETAHAGQGREGGGALRIWIYLMIGLVVFFLLRQLGNETVNTGLNIVLFGVVIWASVAFSRWLYSEKKPPEDASPPDLE